ncbi:MAG: hypothetical protein HON32_03380 [Francisellaceae bacterium]|jgi:hypothetical protein|nr:hypothetical protein [Francisellaceae bacterium]MBT6539632.1 hypothetical protein [Francisellaceae bacterium]
MIVYVLNCHGKPLMPCKPQRARMLLKEDKAKVITKAPFTIKILFGSTGYKQPVIAGFKVFQLNINTFILCILFNHLQTVFKTYP